MRFFNSILIFMLSFGILSWIPFTHAAQHRLVITGSSTVAPVISDLARAFEKKHANFRIDVQTGGSSRGIADVRNQVADIGMVSRSLKKSEVDLKPYTFAKDGLSIITHKSNPIASLSNEQIRDVYLGKIKDWQELGGKAGKIVIVNKAEGRSTLELFLKFFRLKNSAIQASVIIGDNEQGIKTVAGNPNAIAYVSVGAAEYNASVGTPIRLVPYKGVDASVANVRKGTYPLLRDLNLVTKGAVKKSAEQFIQFVQSKAAHKTIQDHYLVAN